jgi:hypothetical protein
VQLFGGGATEELLAELGAVDERTELVALEDGARELAMLLATEDLIELAIELLTELLTELLIELATELATELLRLELPIVELVLELED